MNLVTYFKKNFTSGLEFEDIKTRDQVFFFNFFAFFFALICAFSGIRQLLQNNFTSAFFLLSILVLVILTMLIYPPQKNYKKGSYVIIVLIYLACIYTFWFADHFKYGWMFILFYPFFNNLRVQKSQKTYSKSAAQIGRIFFCIS